MHGSCVSPQMTDMRESLVALITLDLPLAVYGKVDLQPAGAVEMFPTVRTDSSVMVVSFEFVGRLPSLRGEGEITVATFECEV